jgi:hypothetical protein
MSSTFVPPDFEIPQQWRNEQFWLWPLTPADLDEDHAAVTESEPELHAVFSPAHHWPAPDLTREQNRIDLAMHEREFAERAGFAYVIGSPDGQHYLGCLYLYPTAKPFDVQAYFWVRSAQRTPGREDELLRALNSWLTTAWPFQKVAFPGRSIGWAEWRAIPPSEPAPVVGA